MGGGVDELNYMEEQQEHEDTWCGRDTLQGGGQPGVPLGRQTPPSRSRPLCLDLPRGEPSLGSVGVGLAPCTILGHSPRPPTHLLVLEVPMAERALPLPVARLAQPRRALSRGTSDMEGPNDMSLQPDQTFPRLGLA